jgi:hypothetical protein
MRYLVALLLSVSTAALAGDPVGAWIGTYRCAQGVTGGDLVIAADGAGGLRAVFHFFADATNPGVPEGCFTMSGALDAQGAHITLRPGAWIVRPPNFGMAGLEGDIDPLGTTIDGHVTGFGSACGAFHLRFTSLLPPARVGCRIAP